MYKRQVKSGTLSLTGSSQPGSVKISGLTSDGSYYLSAVFVDAREERSPLKVISFTTPDNTVPNFASGYPYKMCIRDRSFVFASMALTAYPTTSMRGEAESPWMMTQMCIRDRTSFSSSSRGRRFRTWR